jgi:hypothetical protein
MRATAGTLASLVLLLAPLGAVPALRAQEDAAMMKDKAMQGPLAEGMFAGSEEHEAAGTVHLVGSGTGHRLHFTPDFKVERGPDVYVTLTDSTGRVTGSSLVLAKLTKFSGEQVFDLPAGAEPARYARVVLWCKKYRVKMGEAPLAMAGKGMDGMMKEEGGAMKKDEGM